VLCGITPYKGYCVSGQVQTAQGVNPVQPYYFPFVRNNEEYLEGFFDYRPRNEQEATVAAISTDLGKSWIFKDEALGLNPYCPADPTDPDNNNVIVDGLSTPYASRPHRWRAARSRPRPRSWCTARIWRQDHQLLPGYREDVLRKVTGALKVRRRTRNGPTAIENAGPDN